MNSIELLRIRPSFQQIATNDIINGLDVLMKMALEAEDFRSRNRIHKLKRSIEALAYKEGMQVTMAIPEFKPSVDFNIDGKEAQETAPKELTEDQKNRLATKGMTNEEKLKFYGDKIIAEYGNKK